MKKTIIIHLVLWTVFGVLEYMAYPDARLLESNIFFVLRMMLYGGIFYYNSLFLFDILFKRKTVWKGLGLQALSMIVYGTIFYYLFTYFYFDTYAERLKGMEKEFPNIDRSPEQINRARTAIMIIYYMITFFAALFYWLWRRVRVANKTTMRMEKEKLQDENRDQPERHRPPSPTDGGNQGNDHRGRQERPAFAGDDGVGVVGFHR